MKNKVKVVVIHQDNYDFDLTYHHLNEGLKLLGGIENFVKKDEKILVKPNFLYPADPKKAITTHPVIISAFLKILNDNNYHNVLVGDSPANGSNLQAISKSMLDESSLYGAKIADMSQEIEVIKDDNKFCKKFYFTKEASEADAIIGLCKMKTHALERITGAVKNMYGLICGSRKAKGHVSYKTDLTFARMLVDIHKTLPIKLHVMDGIVAMEGNGPSSGRPINMNTLLISEDPVAIDTVFSRLIYLKPELVPTITQSKLFGIGESDFENIEIHLIEDNNHTIVSIDELVKKLGNPNFDVVRDRPKFNILQLWSFLSGGTKKPHIDESKCVKCGECVNHCPVDGRAINFINGKDNVPVYDYKKCISCYCCQEICPRHAIYVK